MFTEVSFIFLTAFFSIANLTILKSESKFESSLGTIIFFMRSHYFLDLDALSFCFLLKNEISIFSSFVLIIPSSLTGASVTDEKQLSGMMLPSPCFIVCMVHFNFISHMFSGISRCFLGNLIQALAFWNHVQVLEIAPYFLQHNCVSWVMKCLIPLMLWKLSVALNFY